MEMGMILEWWQQDYNNFDTHDNDTGKDNDDDDYDDDDDDQVSHSSGGSWSLQWSIHAHGRGDGC